MKCADDVGYKRIYRVAPLVGAWIEILSMRIDTNQETVAPLVGAWIEIQKTQKQMQRRLSLLSWERGLKYGKSVEKLFVYESLLSWERGLKSKTGFNRDICQEVAPLVGAWIEILRRHQG